MSKVWIGKPTCYLITVNNRLNFQYKVNPVFIKYKCSLWETRILKKQRDLSQGYTLYLCLKSMRFKQEASFQFGCFLLFLILTILLPFPTNNSKGKDSCIFTSKLRCQGKLHATGMFFTHSRVRKYHTVSFIC